MSWTGPGGLQPGTAGLPFDLDFDNVDYSDIYDAESNQLVNVPGGPQSEEAGLPFDLDFDNVDYSDVYDAESNQLVNVPSTNTQFPNSLRDLFEENETFSSLHDSSQPARQHVQQHSISQVDLGAASGNAPLVEASIDSGANSQSISVSGNKSAASVQRHHSEDIGQSQNKTLPKSVPSGSSDKIRVEGQPGSNGIPPSERRSSGNLQGEIPRTNGQTFRHALDVDGEPDASNRSVVPNQSDQHQTQPIHPEQSAESHAVHKSSDPSPNRDDEHDYFPDLTGPDWEATGCNLPDQDINELLNTVQAPLAQQNEAVQTADVPALDATADTNRPAVVSGAPGHGSTGIADSIAAEANPASHEQSPRNLDDSPSLQVPQDAHTDHDPFSGSSDVDSYYDQGYDYTLVSDPTGDVASAQPQASNDHSHQSAENRDRIFSHFNNYGSDYQTSPLPTVNPADLMSGAGALYSPSTYFDYTAEPFDPFEEASEPAQTGEADVQEEERSMQVPKHSELESNPDTEPDNDSEYVAAAPAQNRQRRSPTTVAGLLAGDGVNQPFGRRSSQKISTSVPTAASLAALPQISSVAQHVCGLCEESGHFDFITCRHPGHEPGNPSSFHPHCLGLSSNEVSDRQNWCCFGCRVYPSGRRRARSWTPKPKRESRIRARDKIIGASDEEESGFSRPERRQKKVSKRRRPEPESDDNFDNVSRASKALKVGHSAVLENTPINPLKRRAPDDDADDHEGTPEISRRSKLLKSQHTASLEEASAVQSREAPALLASKSESAPKEPSKKVTETSTSNPSETKNKSKKQPGDTGGFWTKRDDAVAMQEMMLISRFPSRLKNDDMWLTVAGAMLERGCKRKPNGVKNRWNRHLRLICKIDERMHKDPLMLQTGVLTKKNPNKVRYVNAKWTAEDLDTLFAQVNTQTLDGIPGIDQPAQNHATDNTPATQTTGDIDAATENINGAELGVLDDGEIAEVGKSGNDEGLGQVAKFVAENE
ncbi:MAG: hypothetical protein M1828_006605 [Chrysothrix sp. TS-e1954]|nr:MAG: hypothetical protein M1828_006605 [Chrysothrix sp. TS-e1954]